MRQVVYLAFPVLAASYVLPAYAQDVATAATLFDKGVADMAAGKLDTACPEVAESYRLDPRAGTLFTLAECYAKAGKTASAVSRYQDYLDLYARMTPEQQAKQQDRPKTAAEQKDRLTPDVPMLTLKLPEGASPQAEIKRDGAVLGAASIGLSLPVDPGDHTISTQVPQGPLFTETVTLKKGEQKTLVLTIKPVEPSATTGVGTQASPSGTPPANEDGSRGKGQRVAGLVIGSVGVAGLIVGAITGGITLGKRSTITGNCNVDTKTCKNATGVDATRSAKTTGLVSTVGFIAGGVATAAGLVVFLTTPKSAPNPDATTPNATALELGVGPGSITLSGVF